MKYFTKIIVVLLTAGVSHAVTAASAVITISIESKYLSFVGSNYPSIAEAKQAVSAFCLQELKNRKVTSEKKKEECQTWEKTRGMASSNGPIHMALAYAEKDQSSNSYAVFMDQESNYATYAAVNFCQSGRAAWAKSTHRTCYMERLILDCAMNPADPAAVSTLVVGGESASKVCKNIETLPSPKLEVISPKWYE